MLILEDSQKTRDWMSIPERTLKKKLIALLKDDGNGHHHAKYAACLDKFIVQIVPVGKEPATAAISFDEGIIYINAGFLRDPSTFSQLNVIMRHELCHYLLAHQIRQIKQVAAILPEAHLRTSASIGELNNILADFEISNKKYSKEDKDVVRNTWLNGKLISGLVTEDHRDKWKTLSLEDMYKESLKEMEAAGWNGQMADAKSGNLSHAAARLQDYKNVPPSLPFDTIDEFHDYLVKEIKIANGDDAEMPKEWEDIFTEIKQIVTDQTTEYTKQDIQGMIDAIVNSKPIGKFEIKHPRFNNVVSTVYTPEERKLAIKNLIIIRNSTSYQEDYDNWYKEIMNKLQNSGYSDAEIQELLDIVSK